MTSKVSFTIRRPTPTSYNSSTNASPKPHSRTWDDLESDSDSSDNSQVVLARAQQKKEKGPLVIPSLQNRDWRELARKRRSLHQFVPPSAVAAVKVGPDGSVGGLGTKDAINSGPQLSGLQIRKKVKREEGGDGDKVGVEMEKETKEEETEDQKAIRALLSGTTASDEPQIDTIPPPVSETDAFKQDVEEFPDEATLEDYARVPVSQFGAALLRGMGWKEGDAVGKKGKGMKEPWIPEPRPALLGIGAKEQEVFDDGSGGKGGKMKRPEKRYVPLIKMEREGSGNGSREGSRSRRASPPGSARDSGRSSRRTSRSPQPGRDRYRERERNGRDGEYRDRVRDRDRDGRKNGDSSDRDREGDRDKDRYRDRDNRNRRERDRY